MDHLYCCTVRLHGGGSAEDIEMEADAAKYASRAIDDQHLVSSLTTYSPLPSLRPSCSASS